jgi:hypothetical protein
MSRTAFDAYLHELFALRDIPRFVKFASGSNGRVRLSRERWRLIADKRRSLSGVSKRQKKEYEDVRNLNLSEKLQTILLLLINDNRNSLISDFENRFKWLIALNTIRNALVHHDFGPPTDFLARTCNEIRGATKLAVKSRQSRWEEILSHPPLADWACRTVSLAILEIESINQRRKIHLMATRDAVDSAIAPLKL